MLFVYLDVGEFGGIVGKGVGFVECDLCGGFKLFYYDCGFGEYFVVVGVGDCG